LRKAVHAATNLNVNVVVIDERGKGIFGHDGRRLWRQGCACIPIHPLAYSSRNP
jgi:hypothetical protein